MNLSEFKEKFDPFFLELAKERARRALCVTSNQFVGELLDHSLVLAGSGKRLRPYLAYLGYLAAGGSDDEKIRSVGAGIELFHTFALVHDDIMDADATRRGITTLHEYALAKLGSRRHAEGMAILVGDILFEWARELLPDGELAPYLSAMIDEVIIGQMLDVELAASSSSVSQRGLDEMISLKTASYSFIRPLQIGAAAYGITPDLERFFAQFGQSFGVAFQLQDDYFDRDGDREKDRPSYFTRGFEQEGLSRITTEFERAELVLTAAPLVETTRELFFQLLLRIKNRTA